MAAKDTALAQLFAPTKRTFCANGAVYSQNHFFVDPSEWNKSNLIPKLFMGYYFVLIAPSQTGKTTRVKTLIQQIHTDTSINNTICVYIDLSMVVVPLDPPFFESFVKAFKDYMNKEKISLPNNLSFPDLFSLKSSELWYQGKKIILIIDEVDCLKKVVDKDRINFLRFLRGWKQSRETNCLLSTLLITNYPGDYLIDSIGFSSFNASEYVIASYFTITEIYELIAQYEKQESITILNEIKNDIFEQTGGAQGLTVMYCNQLTNWIDENKRAPTFSEWVNFANSEDFFVNIVKYANYQKMISTVEKSDAYRILLTKIVTGRVLKKDLSTNPIANKLIAANILTTAFTFANPFAKNLVISLLHKNNRLDIELPFSHGKQLDFFELVCLVIPLMNPLSIVGANIMSKNYCGEYPIGPKEAVYVAAFNTALLDALKEKVNTLLYPEVTANGKSCDSVLTLFGQKIAVEHGANLKFDKNSTDRMSVHHHVFQQGEIYHKELKVDQTWVISWTTVPDSSLYYFPDSTVNVLYIYHDEQFTKINISSKGRTRIVQLPPIDFGMEEPSVKKKKPNEPISDLERIAALYKQGILEEEEFKLLKRNILAKLNSTVDSQ